MRAFSRWLLVIVILSLPMVVPGGGSASGKRQQNAAYEGKLQDYFQTQMERYKIPGLAVAIVRDGNVEYLNGFGTANAAGQAVTAGTPFLLASVSKSFIALGVMQLVEQGKINLTDPVQKHIPWFEVSGGKAGEITVAHLLYQTSGFSEVSGVRANLRPDHPDALEEGVRALASETLMFDPGSGWEYSNLNYTVLSLLIQEVSGQRYEDYIAEHIFAPLDMTQSHATAVAAQAAGAARAYYPFFGISVEYDRLLPFSGSMLSTGGLWSSASDMSRYLMAHLDALPSGGAALLSAENIGRLHQPGYMFDDVQGYAMGWTNNRGFMPRDQLAASGSDLVEQDTLTVLFHEGDWAGYKSMAFMIPDLDYGVVLLMNTNDPKITSVFRFFAWDVTLIATGGEPQYFPPAEPFIVQNSLWIFSALAVLFAAGIVWSLHALTRLRRGEPEHAARGRTAFIYGAMPILISAAAVGYLYLKLLPDNRVVPETLFRFAPDLAILLFTITLLAAVWSAVSLMLLGRILRGAPAAALREAPLQDAPL